jgi:hypothetical protein
MEGHEVLYLRQLRTELVTLAHQTINFYLEIS